MILSLDKFKICDILMQDFDIFWIQDFSPAVSLNVSDFILMTIVYIYNHTYHTLPLFHEVLIVVAFTFTMWALRIYVTLILLMFCYGLQNHPDIQGFFIFRIMIFHLIYCYSCKNKLLFFLYHLKSLIKSDSFRKYLTFLFFRKRISNAENKRDLDWLALFQQKRNGMISFHRSLICYRHFDTDFIFSTKLCFKIYCIKH